MAKATSGPDARVLDELLRTARYATTRPHGRMQRFEDSFSPTEVLPPLRPAARLRLGELIGEGGMGRVHLATQAALDRTVAVKTLRAETEGPSLLGSFLQEARVTGLVEHPNVLPVYDLLVTEDGAPALVMKRVVGMPWPQILAKPELVPADDAGDPLAFNLRVLMSVCDAVQYAHEIGILHRDIKPENVMIGSLGETYLLDWGIAVSTRPDHAGFIALATEARGLVGTPAYMAPEMVATDATSLSPATDVYLIGATLHEVVTGEPPHRGADLREVAEMAHESAPHDYPLRVPAELAGICQRAMAREPGDRFPSAAALRSALDRFLIHRQSHALAEAGREALSELEQRIASTPDAEGAIEDLFGALRFSLGRALELWPGNDRARAEWQRALGEMARYELSRGRAATATALSAERSDPDEELAAALEQIREERGRRDEEVAQLRSLQREHDLGVSGVTRSRAAIAVGAIWFAIGLAAGRLRAWNVIELDTPLYLGAGIGLIAMIILLIATRPELLANEVNRRIMVAVAGGALAVLFGRIVAAVYDQDILLTAAREQLVYALQSALIAIISDLRILAGAGALVVSAAAGSAWPELALELGALGVLLATATMALAWRGVP